MEITSDALNRVLADVVIERGRQDYRWEDQDLVIFSWVAELTEQVDEAVESTYPDGDVASLREELVQVAAVAVAWIECLDRQAEQRSIEWQ